MPLDPHVFLGAETVDHKMANSDETETPLTRRKTVNRGLYHRWWTKVINKMILKLPVRGFLIRVGAAEELKFD